MALNTHHTGRRHVHLRLPLRGLVITGLVILIAALSGWLGWAAYESHKRDIAVDQAVEAAKSYALIIANVDADTVDKNFTDLYNSSTKDFNDTHATQGAALRDQLIEKKVSSHGTIKQVTVKSVTLDKVTVELLINQSVSNVDTPRPLDDQTRITVTMEKVGDRWLTNDIKIL